GIGGMEPSNEKKDASEGDSEEEVLASSSLLVDIDAKERLPTIHREVEPSSRAFTSPQQTSFCIRFTKESTDRQPAMPVITLRVMISLEFGNRYCWV
ncbi:hypothetical protein PIB30_070750, partial [Stylosanthes scabra]|nr:hypothetical protein [Stylosanthes scabra]